jgi:hypothetical protein
MVAERFRRYCGCLRKTKEDHQGRRGQQEDRPARDTNRPGLASKERGEPAKGKAQTILIQPKRPE